MAAPPSLPQAGVLGEEGDIPHLVLPEVGREALLPVLPDVDGAREEVLVYGDDGRGLVAPPLVAAGRNPESQPASLALFRSVSHCSTWAGHPVVNRTAVKQFNSPFCLLTTVNCTIFTINQSLTGRLNPEMTIVKELVRFL